MKPRIMIIGMLFASLSLVVLSCNKTSDDLRDGIEGTYVGTITRTTSLKSAHSDTGAADHGIAEVTLKGEHQIEVHCVGSEIDTTFELGYYLHRDSAYVCLVGDDFEHMYGHMPGAGHMGGAMMGDIGPEETEWMHHLNDEHVAGDEHFGGFDMHRGTFTYSIRMMDEEAPYYMKFNGSKEQ